ncbi:hypothetical protein HDU98_001019, partial [Podochytrium sp. JEL0797]
MGTGKTVMMIGLVAATLQYPIRLLDEEGWRTGVPGMEGNEWITRVANSDTRHALLVSPHPMRIPTLVEMSVAALRYARSHALSEHMESLPTHLNDAYLRTRHYTTAEFVHASPRREHFRGSVELRVTSRGDEANRVYLSNTTLLVVPDTLVHQWMSEFSKHLHASVVTRLDLSDPKMGVPEAKEIVEYDVVLVSHSRLARECSAFGVESTGVPVGCRCAYKGNTRVVECRCLKAPPRGGEVSPLMRVWFRRLVFDEGHLLKHEDGGVTRLLDTVGKLRAGW